MTVLADTSVWVDHLRRGNARLARLLDEGDVTCHPFVAGELACGGIRNRVEFLRMLRALPAAPLAEHEEVLAFVEVERLHGRGLGWIDVHLLASVRLAGGRLWTLDRPLRAAAASLGVADPGAG